MRETGPALHRFRGRDVHLVRGMEVPLEAITFPVYAVEGTVSLHEE